MMPGPVSDSYEGPSDTPGELPAWAGGPRKKPMTDTQQLLDEIRRRCEEFMVRQEHGPPLATRDRALVIVNSDVPRLAAAVEELSQFARAVALSDARVPGHVAASALGAINKANAALRGEGGAT